MKFRATIALGGKTATGIRVPPNVVEASVRASGLWSESAKHPGTSTRTRDSYYAHS